VTDWLDLPFVLVPQRDRRQLPDRRAYWRGSRRAYDMAGDGKTVAQHGSAFAWAAAQHDPSPSTADKLY
jgi:hypothetical protein